MFTGLVEACTKVNCIELKTDAKGNDFLYLVLTRPQNFDINTGDSIAVNGCCLTVENFDDDQISFYLNAETFTRTTARFLAVSHDVNLERALKASDRLGGHIVSGHIDGTAAVKALEKNDSGWNLQLMIPIEFSKFLVTKGSLAVNGVSLTINNLIDLQGGTLAEFMLIPVTLAHTNLHALKAGDLVNFEVDILAKHLERLVKFK